MAIIVDATHSVTDTSTCWPTPLRLAGEQGHCRRAGAEKPALVLGLEAAVLEGRPSLDAADAHYHAHSVGNDLRAGVVAVGPGLPEGGYGGHHQLGIDCGQAGVPDAQVVKVAGAAAFNYQIHL